MHHLPVPPPRRTHLPVPQRAPHLPEVFPAGERHLPRVQGIFACLERRYEASRPSRSSLTRTIPSPAFTPATGATLRRPRRRWRLTKRCVRRGRCPDCACEKTIPFNKLLQHLASASREAQAQGDGVFTVSWEVKLDLMKDLFGIVWHAEICKHDDLTFFANLRGMKRDGTTPGSTWQQEKISPRSTRSRLRPQGQLL